MLNDTVAHAQFNAVQLPDGSERTANEGIFLLTRQKLCEGIRYVRLQVPPVRDAAGPDPPGALSFTSIFSHFVSSLPPLFPVGPLLS